jgi:xylose isomerase
MEDLLRPAVCYWHSVRVERPRHFRSGTFDRPWNAGVMDQAAAWPRWMPRSILHAPRHAVLLLPRRRRDADGFEHQGTRRQSRETVDRLEKKQAETGIKLLWGTANLFSHPRYMGGASTNPGSGCLGVRGHAGASLHGRHQAPRRR